MQQARQNSAARQQPPRNNAPAGVRRPQGRVVRSSQASAVTESQNRADQGRTASKQVRKPLGQQIEKTAVKAKKKKKVKDPNRVRFFTLQGRVDVPMLIIIMVLLVFGITMMFSAGHALSYSENNGDSFAYVTQQMKAAGLGLAAMFVLSFFDYRFLRHEFKLFGGKKSITVTHLFLFFAMFLNLLTIPFGVAAEGGQKRWLPVPGLGQFQPSDILKIAVIVYFAYFIHKNSDKMRKFYDGILRPGVMLAIIILSMISQWHLSFMVIICVVFVAMLLRAVQISSIRRPVPLRQKPPVR